MIKRQFFSLSVFFSALTFSSLIVPSLSGFHSEWVENSESKKLSNLFENLFEELQKESPELATFIGAKDCYNGKWTDYTEEGFQARHRMLNVFFDALHEIDKSVLSADERINYDLFEKDLADSLEGDKFQSKYMAIDQLGGIPFEVESILMMMPRVTVADYENLLSRLSGVPLVIEQTLNLLKTGLQKDITQPQIVLRNLPNLLLRMTPEDVKTSVFFQPFLSFSESIDARQADEYANKAHAIIENEVYPAYNKLRTYLETTYIPSCRTSVGLSELPQGEAFYQHCVKKHTTTELSPIEIHGIGLKEVERIQGQMRAIIEEVGFSGTIADYLDYLNTSPEFFYTQPEDLIAGYRQITSYIDDQLPALFGRFPKLPYEVVPIPEYIAEGQVSAYYMRGSLETGRPGRFFANTTDLGSRAKWQMETLALHEAVPGHHFQISIAQEIEGLPEFRKYNNYTAYIEGWGLYSESLGGELGLQRTPENRFGRLRDEIWRAARLVVDTGIHGLGWTRDQAIAYMQQTTGLSLREVTTEVDRYIVWPGQALAYKIGELSIQRWRREAKETLGERFDIRAFHDMLLGQGALPLDVCEEQVRVWISNQQKS
jgi:uncharacterized protein (DUF885 family)